LQREEESKAKVKAEAEAREVARLAAIEEEKVGILILRKKGRKRVSSI
jgi:hypothetical protein